MNSFKFYFNSNFRIYKEDLAWESELSEIFVF